MADLLLVLKAKVKLVASNWFLLLVLGLFAGLGGFFYAQYQKPIYKATLTFVTDDLSGSSSANAYLGLAAQFGLNVGAARNVFTGDNLILLLRSKTLIVNTLRSPFYNRELIIEAYLRNHKMNEAIEKKFHHPLDFNQKNNRAADSVIVAVYEAIVKSSLTVGKVDINLDLIYIEMNDLNEAFAKKFVEALCSNAISYYAAYKSKKARENLEILQMQSDSLRSKLFGNIQEVAVSSDLNVNPLRQQVRTGVQKKQVDLQANAALYAELLKQKELASIVLRNNTPLIQVIDNPTLPLPIKKPGRLLYAVLFSFISISLMVIFIIVLDYFRRNSIKN